MSAGLVDAACEALGPVGVCLPVSFTDSPDADLQREAVVRLATMRDYLDGMDGPTWPPAPKVGYPRIIAAQVREHVAAGAYPVTLLLPVGVDFATGVDRLEQLAQAPLVAPAG